MHSHSLLVINVVLGLGFLGMALSRDEARASLRRRILTALQEARITNKEVCALTGYEQSRWSKVMSGEHDVSFDRLIPLPYAFWLAFQPEFAWLIAILKVEEIGDSVHRSIQSKREVS